jgi:hypothetical protein
MTTRSQRFLFALLIAFLLWCFDAFLQVRKVTAEQIQLEKFEGVFYPAIAQVQEMYEGYEDYQAEANSWGKRPSMDGAKRGKS